MVNKFPGRNTSSLCELTVPLARNVVFGDTVLARSSLSGRNDSDQLDTEKLAYIKSIVRGQVGLMGDHEFELVWKKCLESLGKMCSKLRAKRLVFNNTSYAKIFGMYIISFMICLL